jgi:glycosyl transferase, family 25
MNCYIINLDRSTDRFAHISKLLSGSGLDVVRVSAVDGDRLPEDDLSQWRSHNRIWSPMSAREIGCFLSHRNTWKLIVESGKPWAFVCEDDIHFSRHFARFLGNSEWLPGNADIVKAETMRSRVEMSVAKTAEIFGHSLRQLKSEHLGSAGYFVSREACEKLLDLTTEYCEPADRVLFSPRSPIAPLLRIHQIDPALCIQDFHLASENAGVGFVSEIPVERNAKRATVGWRPKLSKLWRETKRPVGQFSKTARRVSLTLTGRSLFKAIGIDVTPD